MKKKKNENVQLKDALCNKVINLLYPFTIGLRITRLYFRSSDIKDVGY